MAAYYLSYLTSVWLTNIFLGRIIDHINKHEGVEWVTFEQMCDHFKSTNTPVEGALMPAAAGAILEKK